jgi:hypothetical protein
MFKCVHVCYYLSIANLLKLIFHCCSGLIPNSSILIIYLMLLSLLDMYRGQKCPPREGILIGCMRGHSVIMGIDNEQ